MAKHTTRHVPSPEELAENPVFAEQMTAFDALARGEDFVQVSTGFPPYFKMSLGKMFRAEILMRDERDPNFVRYHMKNTGPFALDCQEGPTSDGVIITVEPGGIFTISEYKGIPFDTYMGFEIIVMCRAEDRLPANEASKGVPRDFFRFAMKVSSKVEALVLSQRKEDLAFIQATQRDAARLAYQEVARLNAVNRARIQAGAIPSPNKNGSRSASA